MSAAPGRRPRKSRPGQAWCGNPEPQRIKGLRHVNLKLSCRIAHGCDVGSLRQSSIGGVADGHLLHLHLGPGDWPLPGIKHAAEEGLTGWQSIFRPRLEPHCRLCLGGVHLFEHHRFESRRGNDDAEQEVGTQRLDLELSLSIRRGALAAIRIARGSGVTPPHARPGFVNEDPGTGHRATQCAHDAAHKIRPSRRERGRAGRQWGMRSESRNLFVRGLRRPGITRSRGCAPEEHAPNYHRAQQTRPQQPRSPRIGFGFHGLQLTQRCSQGEANSGSNAASAHRL